MNWKPLLLACAALCVASLTSCDTFPRKSDGNTIYYPTVTDMERYEAEWGTQPKAAPAAAGTMRPSTGAYVPSGSPPPVMTTAPATVPLEAVSPETPPAIPPSLR